jgi:hypothetical protein
LSLLTRQCLDRRLPDIPALQQQAKAWYEKRNAKQKSVTGNLQVKMPGSS